MNLKKTSIALAFASIAASPTTFADKVKVETDVYASLRLGVASTDTEDADPATDDRKLDVVSRFSRIGFKGKTDLGNGLKAFGHYEYEVDAAITDDGNDRTRLGYVGIEGNFGKILVGQNYHTFYNHIVGPADIPWNFSGFAQVTYQGRSEETLTYSNSIGPVDFGVSLVMDGESADDEDIDETELGLTYKLGSTKLGLGYISIADDEEDILGLSAAGSVGAFSLAANYQIQEQADGDDLSSIVADISAYNVYLHLEQFMDDTSGDPEASLVTLGYTWSVGKNTSVWFEYADYDTDLPTGSIQNFEVILKYDI